METGKIVRAARRAVAAVAAVAVLMPTVLVAPAGAQGAPRRVVRDAETEALIGDYTRPLFKAAGIRSSSVQLFIVPAPSFNAFVANGQNMFINTGAIIASQTPNEIIGVLAHETGHLAGGHQARLREQLERAQAMAWLGMLAGIGAIGAGIAAKSSDVARAGQGIAAGGSEIAKRSFLSYARSEELAADRSAITYLEKTGQSANGMLVTFQRFADDGLISSRSVNPYLQSHPMPRERIEQIEGLARQSKFFNAKDAPDLQARHDLVRAKLSAFSEDPALVARRYGVGETGLPARYARAVLAYRMGNQKGALAQLDALIKAKPNYPYFWELKGQILLEGGKAREALGPLRKAVALAPGSGLIRILLGQALVETGDKGLLEEAVKNLSVGLQKDPAVSDGYRHLGRAYAMRGDLAMAELATAQGDFASGNFKDARLHAERAQAKLKIGSPGWLRADDILSYKPPKPD